MHNNKWFAWLSMGLVLLTLLSAIVSASPNLHQLFHDHVEFESHENHGEDELPDSNSHSGSCLACSLESESFGNLASIQELKLSFETFEPVPVVYRSEIIGTADYLFPLSQAPPLQG